MVMMNEPSTKGVAMFSEKASNPRTSNPLNMKLNSKGKLDCWCTHCKKSGHIKEIASSYMERRKLLFV